MHIRNYMVTNSERQRGGRRNTALSVWELIKTAILMYYCRERKIPQPGIEPPTSCVLTTRSLHYVTEAT